ncbi:UvrD-helicase domain-containing protein [Enterovibrio sp. ZSDZ42]|uniref:DNA 3'-5' helicase n=1 Tax=Enterovibrio gelatinilyticus TaxID=2899819 RepID=A0ABT5QYQ4_9GAMM|nr:UvrD-helicase domain-containing protein [Enterovibrio sp. ZSDZ42]MDD1793143.1 UvrD-helicase domain-containing protein [Enterovibrio sp. ZSDZ42]
MLKPISLVGEQRKVLSLNHEGPIQIKGAAGSGKTTVAIYRACHLMNTHADLFEPSKVAVFSFNKSLSAYLKVLANSLGDYDYSDLTVIHFHKWAYHFLEQQGFKLNGRVFDEDQAKYRLSVIINKIKDSEPSYERILSKRIEFYLDEVSWLKGKNILSLEEYQETKRSGRGTTDRVTSSDKIALWEVFQQYRHYMQSNGKYDFDDFALLCLDVIAKQAENFGPHFTHIVIDEAQDLSKAQVSVLSKIVSPTTNSITIIADAAQRIYKSGFVWKEVGLNVRGSRTIEFKKNYRNTAVIAKAALSLLAHDNDTDDFTTVEVGDRDGEKTLIISASNEKDELSSVLERVKNKHLSNKNESICLIHRTRQGVVKLGQLLLKNGFKISNISMSDKNGFSDDCIYIATMQSVKGLEFDHVFLCSLESELLPIAAGFSEPDDDLHISTERRLLYTCMTRATQTLTLSYSNAPSRFLSEINSEFVDRVNI